MSSTKTESPLLVGISAVVAVVVGGVALAAATAPHSAEQSPQPVIPQVKPSSDRELVVEVGYRKLRQPVSAEPKLVINGSPAKYPITGGTTEYVSFIHRSNFHAVPPQVTATMDMRRTRHLKVEVWCTIQYGSNKPVHHTGQNTVTCQYPKPN